MRSFATHSELPAATVTADSTIPAVQCDAAKRLFAAFATDTPDVRVGSNSLILVFLPVLALTTILDAEP